MSEPVYRDTAAGVTIPLSTIIGGSQTGVLKHLKEGLEDAAVALAMRAGELRDAQAVVERLELAVARAESKVDAWRTAHDAAKAAFDL